MSGRFRLLLGPRTVQGLYDLTPKALPGTFKLGINMSGPESGNGYPTYDMLAHYAAHGMLLIRQPLGWTQMQPSIGYAISSSEFSKLSAMLAMAKSLGMSVIIDANHTTSLGAGRAEGILGSSAVPTSAVASYLASLSTLLQADPSYSAVHGYEPINEPNYLDPNSTTGSGVTPYSQGLVLQLNNQCVTALRNAGEAKLYYVVGDHYDGAWDWVDNNSGWFSSFNDPGHNSIVTIHTYLDHDSSGGNFAWLAETAKPGLSPPGLATNTLIGVQRLSKVVAWAYAHGVKLHLGECGWGIDDPGWNQAGDALLTYLQACNIEFTYWSSGFNFQPAGGGGYGYDPDPYLPGSLAHIFTAGTSPSSQSVILQKYASAPTTYVLSLPADSNLRPVRYAANGAASAPFKILFGGKITSPITITPHATLSDGVTGAGGTFTPASVTLTAGQHINDSVSFTYTPSQSAQFIISTTNNGGLVDPPPLTFSSVLDPFVQSGITVDPLAVFWPKRIYSTYTGKAATLALTSTLTSSAGSGTTQDINFLANDLMDTATLDAWSGGAATSVVTLYDQGLAKANLQPIITSPGDNQAGPALGPPTYAGTYLPVTPNLDYPAFVENVYNGLPALRFNASRMDAPISINGLGGFTLLLALKPQTLADAAFILDWRVADFFQICDASGNWLISPETTQSVPVGIQAAQMHTYALRFDGNAQLRDVFRDGVKLSPSVATSETVIRNEVSPGTGDYDSISKVHVGWFAYYPSGKSKFDLAGFIALPAALTDSQIGVFMTRMMNDLGVVVIGQPGAMTLSASPGSANIAVQIASAATNATSNIWQYSFQGQNSWTTAATTSSATLTYNFTGLDANTLYDLQAIPTNGTINGPASQLIGTRTGLATAGTNGVIANIGLNYSGLEGGSAIDPTSRVTQQQYHSSVGVSLIRLPFLFERMFTGVSATTLNGTNVTDYHNAIDNIVNPTYGPTGHWICLIDAHNYGGPYGYLVGSSNYTLAQWGAQWAAIVTDLITRYGATKVNSQIRIDLQNEPGTSSAGTYSYSAWIAACNQAISSIRNAGFTGKIHVPVLGANSAGYFYGPYIGDIVDSLSNFLIEFHQYSDDGQAGSSSTNSPTRSLAWLRGVAARARYQGVQLHWGEFGNQTINSGIPDLHNAFDYIQDNSDVFESATWFASGAVSATDLNHAIYPYNADGTLDAPITNATPAYNGPQMQAMVPYMAGGNRRGQKGSPAAVAETTIAGVGTFGSPIYPGFGGALTGISGSSNDGQGTNFKAGALISTITTHYQFWIGPDGVMTIEMFINVPVGTTTAFFLSGITQMMMPLVAPNFVTYYNGLSSTLNTGISLADGNPHHLALVGGPSGIKMFLDGVCPSGGSTSTPLQVPNPFTTGSSSRPTILGDLSGNNLPPAGVKISHITWTGAQKYTNNFTPNTTTPPTGRERGVIYHFPLTSNLLGVG